MISFVGVLMNVRSYRLLDNLFLKAVEMDLRRERSPVFLRDSLSLGMNSSVSVGMPKSYRRLLSCGSPVWKTVSAWATIKSADLNVVSSKFDQRGVSAPFLVSALRSYTYECVIPATLVEVTVGSVDMKKSMPSKICVGYFDTAHKVFEDLPIRCLGFRLAICQVLISELVGRVVSHQATLSADVRFEIGLSNIKEMTKEGLTFDKHQVFDGMTDRVSASSAIVDTYACVRFFVVMISSAGFLDTKLECYVCELPKG